MSFVMDFRVGQFNGPLDLLLALIEDQKLSINEVSLSQVTEQYLKYLDTLEEERADELADFLVIAAKLLLLKSRLLLPQFLPEEEEGPGLAEQLRLYKVFLQASKTLHDQWLTRARSYGRVEPRRKSAEFVMPPSLTTDVLFGRMTALIRRLKPPKPLPQTKIDRAVSIKEKIDAIRSFLKVRKSVHFHELIENAGNKSEIIVGFLALLELMKQRTVLLEQEDSFGQIRINRV